MSTVLSHKMKPQFTLVPLFVVLTILGTIANQSCSHANSLKKGKNKKGVSNSRKQYDRSILDWVRKVLNELGANAILDGTRKTNKGPLKGPYNLITPSSTQCRFYTDLAVAAYCIRNLETWTCPYCLPGYKLNEIITNTTLQTLVYFAVNDQRKEILTSYRGSQNALNFLADAIAVPVPLKNNKKSKIKLHLGFKVLFESLWPRVLEKLKKLTKKYPDYKLIFTGHSLGANDAALSIFYIHYFKEKALLGKKIELYTYGQSRLGNRAMADFMNNLSVTMCRVVERSDAPTRITSPAVLGYYHFGRETWVYDIQGPGKDRNCSTLVYEDENCSDSKGPLYSFLDHFTYYHVDILICYALQDPILFALQFLIPVKQFIPKPLLDLIPILPIQEGGVVAKLLREVTQILG